MSQAEAFLRDQVPSAMQSLIPTTLKIAYEAAAAHIKDSPFLNIPSAQDNHGRIISWAVDFGMQKLVESGQFAKADCRWQPFASPTGRYLEILLPYSVITISQVKNPRQQPRDVRFRQNKRLSQQGFLGLEDFKKDHEVAGLPHILIIHGHQSLNFAHLALPNENHSQGYIYRTPNLLLLPHQVPQNEVPPPENTDAEAVMTLKEEIDKWRRDNGA